MLRLRALWSRLIEGLWFVPAVIVAGAIVLAIGMVELSAAVNAEALSNWPRIFGAGAEGSRSMLAAIAGSMITVAGVTFSITMVAVTQASSQYTPRILRNFMRDRANQVVLGVFVGVFAYCLVVLRTIRGGDGYTFVPSVAVVVGVLLAIAGIAILIFFVHHIATTLQASEIVARITRETVEAIDRLFPDTLDPAAAEPADADDLPLGRDWYPVTAPSTGFVQWVGGSELRRAADEHRVDIAVTSRAGDFVIEGLPLGWVAAREGGGAERRLDDGTAPLARHFSIGTYRTIDQDASFGIRQLVDIALKALSPGINDTTTAVTCVDHLGAILVRAADRRIGPTFRSDDGIVSAVGRGPSFELLLTTAYDEIRRSGANNVSVLTRQLAMLEALASRTRAPARRALVLTQVRLVEATVAESGMLAHDRAVIDSRAARALAAVLREPGRTGSPLRR